MAIVTTEGDAGDLIYLLAILRAMPGGPHTLLVEEKSDFTATGKNSGAANLHAFAKDLVLAQPYIQDFRVFVSGEQPMWRSGGFRGAGLHRRTEPLLHAHLNHLNQVTGMGLKFDTSEPWLSVLPVMRSQGRVIINRTIRYKNRHFPWSKIVQHYGDKIAFIGLPHEHAIFCNDFGPVEHIKTRTMMEMAKLIAGSELFIGNQSCAFALAEGMKHTAIQETARDIPDCIFKRDNVQHVWDGSCVLPAVGDTPSTRLKGNVLHTGLVSTMITPPMPGWQFPGIAPQETYPRCEEIVRTLTSMRGKSNAEITEEIKQYNLDKYPDFYRPKQDGENVRMAQTFAGY